MPKKKKEYPDWAITKGRRSRWEEEERKKRLITRAISAAIVVVVILVAIVVIDAIADDDNDNVTILKVNDHSIKMDYFVDMLRLNGIASQDADQYESFAKQILSSIQQRELISQSAADRGVAVTDEEIQAKIDELYTPPDDSDGGDQTSSVSYDTIVKRLESMGISESFFREQLGLDILAKKMVDVIGAEEVPAEMPQANLRTILIDTSIDEPVVETTEAAEEADTAEQPAEDATEGTEEQPVEESVAEEKQDPEAIRAVIQARLAGGEDFATLAEAFSQDSSSKINGGELGWLADEYISLYYGDTFKEAAFNTALKTLSDPIPTSTSSGNTYYWLIEVLEREDSRALGEDQKDILYSHAFSEWFDEETSDQPELSIENATLQDAITKALGLG